MWYDIFKNYTVKNVLLSGVDHIVKGFPILKNVSGNFVRGSDTQEPVVRKCHISGWNIQLWANIQETAFEDVICKSSAIFPGAIYQT